MSIRDAVRPILGTANKTDDNGVIHGRRNLARTLTDNFSARSLITLCPYSARLAPACSSSTIRRPIFQLASSIPVFTALYIVLRVLIMIARISSYRVVIVLIFNAFEDGTHCVPKVCYFCSFDALGILQPFKNPCFNTLRNVEFRDSASFKKASKDNTYKPNGMRIFLSSSKITVCSL